MAKYENPAELDYRNGGDTVDDFAQKYMRTVDYIIKALNDLRTPTGNTAGVEPEPYMWRIADNKLYIRNGDNTDYVLLGEISPNFGFRQSVNDRFLTTADLEGEGAVVTRNEAGKVEGDITGSPGKIANKTIDVTPSADNDVIAYDAAQQKWVKKTLNDYLKKQGDAGWDEMVDEVADQVIEDITPIIFNFWYLDDDGYLVPLVGSTEGGLPSIHGMVGDYEQITARSVEVAGNLSATGNVTAGMLTTPQANVTTLTANAVNAGTLTANDIIAKGPVVDVRAFGAVGDGVHDDTSAIQTAINNYTVIYIPAGNYLITQDLNVTHTGYKIIYGDNAVSTRLIGNTGNYLLDLTGSNNIILANLFLDCAHGVGDMFTLDNPSCVGIGFGFVTQGNECLYNKTYNVKINLEHQTHSYSEGSIGIYGTFEESTHVGLSIYADTPLYISTHIMNDLQSIYLRDGESYIVHGASMNTFSGETVLNQIGNDSAVVLRGTHTTSFENLYINASTNASPATCFKLLDDISNIHIRLAVEGRATVLKLITNAWLKNAQIYVTDASPYTDTSPYIVLQTNDTEIPYMRDVEFHVTDHHSGVGETPSRQLINIDGSLDNIILQFSSNVKFYTWSTLKKAMLPNATWLKMVRDFHLECFDCTLDANKGIYKISKIAPLTVYGTSTTKVIMGLKILKDRSTLKAGKLNFKLSGFCQNQLSDSNTDDFYAEFAGIVCARYSAAGVFSWLPRIVDCTLTNKVTSNATNIDVSTIKFQAGESEDSTYKYITLSVIPTLTGVNAQNYASLLQNIELEIIGNIPDGDVIEIANIGWDNY